MTQHATCIDRVARIALSFCLLAAASTHADCQGCIVDCDGAQEVPPVDTDGSATLLITVDSTTRLLTVDGTFANMGGRVSEAHVHGPAQRGSAGPTVLDLIVTGSRFGTVRGSGVLSLAHFDDLLEGLLYVNVHARGAPAGEVRGQIECGFVVATTSFRNGSGINASILTSTAVPQIGTTWIVAIDRNKAPATIMVVFAGRRARIPRPAGELLALPPVAGITISKAGSHSLAIPNDCSLMGVRLHCQGLVPGKGGLRLTNALDLRLGI